MPGQTTGPLGGLTPRRSRTTWPIRLVSAIAALRGSGGTGRLQAVRTLCGVTCVLVALVGCDGETPPDGADAGGDDAGFDGGGTGTEPCGPDAGPRDAGVATGLTSVCADALIMSGFGLRWADEARNVARLGVHPALGESHFPEGCPPTSALRGADLVSRLDDGTGEATGGRVSATYHVVGAGEGGEVPDAGADGGAWLGLRTARGAATVRLDGEAEATAPQLFDLAPAGMGGAPAIAVVLDGFEVDTDVLQGPGYPPDYDPARGYTVRGLGAWIDGVTRDGDDLSFSVGARLALGRSDDPDMNAASPVARSEIVVHYLVVALPVAPATGTIAYREQHRGHGPAELEVCRPEPGTTALSIDGPPLPHAAAALTRFLFSFYADEGTEGDRLRELSVRIGDFAYDPATGDATMHVEGYASNAGPPPPRLPMDYEVMAEVALLSWEGDGAVASLRLDAPVGVGRDEVPMPFTPR